MPCQIRDSGIVILDMFGFDPHPHEVYFDMKIILSLFGTVIFWRKGKFAVVQSETGLGLREGRQ